MSSVLKQMKIEIDKARPQKKSIREAAFQILSNYDQIKHIPKDVIAHAIGMTKTYPTEIDKFFKLIEHIRDKDEIIG